MNENDISYLIFLIIDVVVLTFVWKKQLGIRGTIDYLEEEGIL